MQELIKTIVVGLVDDKNAVSVTVDEPKEDGTIVYHIHVAADEMGRVIGKQGRIAKAIRTVVRASATKAEQKVLVEID
ncbi:MAG: KH domain-containing protein [Oscillospiraceae bacterium]